MLASHYAEAGAPKGEIVIVVGPPDAEALLLSPETIDAKLSAALVSLSVKDAADIVAAETGISRREIYQRAVALAGSRKKKK